MQEKERQEEEQKDEIARSKERTARERERGERLEERAKRKVWRGVGGGRVQTDTEAGSSPRQGKAPPNSLRPTGRVVRWWLRQRSSSSMASPFAVSSCGLGYTKHPHHMLRERKSGDPRRAPRQRPKQRSQGEQRPRTVLMRLEPKRWQMKQTLLTGCDPQENAKQAATITEVA